MSASTLYVKKTATCPGDDDIPKLGSADGATDKIASEPILLHLDKPLYNSRVFSTYIQYIRHHFPFVDIDKMLESTGLNIDAVEDPNRWFSIREICAFQKAVKQATGLSNIAREAGRFYGYANTLGIVHRMLLASLSPAFFFRIFAMMVPRFDLGHVYKIKRTGSRHLCITVRTKPGIVDQDFQCENRMGLFEVSAMPFTARLAQVEHSLCLHLGDDCCRYDIKWALTPTAFWKRLRNVSIVLLLPMLLAMPVVAQVQVSLSFLQHLPLLLVLFFLGATQYLAQRAEATELRRSLYTTTSFAHQRVFDEASVRRSNALLMQEIGQVTTSNRAEADLTDRVLERIGQHLDVDAGCAILTSSRGTGNSLVAGFGLSAEQLDDIELSPLFTGGDACTLYQHLRDNLEPLLVEHEPGSSPILLPGKKLLGSLTLQQLAIVPMVFEEQLIGLLLVGACHHKRQIRSSELSLLVGIASQLSVAITSARAFARLVDSERHYRELVQSAGSAIVRVDADGGPEFFNTFGLGLLDVEDGDFSSRPLQTWLFASPNDRPWFEHAMRSDETEACTHVQSWQRRDGKRVWIAWSCRRLHKVRGTELLLVGSDMTALHQAEEQRKSLEEQLLQAKKMQAIGTLAGGIAHDFNNMLTGIQGATELALLDIDAGSPAFENLNCVVEYTNSAAALTQQLLSFARGGKNELVPVDINTIVERVCLLFARTRKAVNVERELDKNPCSAMADAGQLEQVLLNLLVNAWQAMAESGTIVVRTQLTEIAADDKERALAPGNYIHMSVCDHGIGMDEQTRQRVFEPFFTTKERGRGTGLGLSTVYGIVQNHNGFVEITSEVGAGCCVHVYVPALVAAVPDAKDAQLFVKTDDKTRVLLVDDEEMVRRVASRMLQKSGYEALVASSGEEAIAIYQREQGHIDLVVLDLMMPGMDGSHTFAALQALDPDVRVVLSSGYSHDGTINDLMQRGCRGFLQKPYRPAALQAKLEEVLAPTSQSS